MFKNAIWAVALILITGVTAVAGSFDLDINIGRSRNRSRDYRDRDRDRDYYRRDRDFVRVQRVRNYYQPVQVQRVQRVVVDDDCDYDDYQAPVVQRQVNVYKQRQVRVVEVPEVQYVQRQKVQRVVVDDDYYPQRVQKSRRIIVRQNVVNGY